MAVDVSDSDALSEAGLEASPEAARGDGVESASSGTSVASVRARVSQSTCGRFVAWLSMRFRLDPAAAPLILGLGVTLTVLFFISLTGFVRALRDQRKDWKHTKKQFRKHPAVSAEAEQAEGVLPFPYASVCSEWWLSPGMQAEWFSNVRARYYQDWYEIWEPDVQFDLGVGQGRKRVRTSHLF